MSNTTDTFRLSPKFMMRASLVVVLILLISDWWHMLPVLLGKRIDDLIQDPSLIVSRLDIVAISIGVHFALLLFTVRGSTGPVLALSCIIFILNIYFWVGDVPLAEGQSWMERSYLIKITPGVIFAILHVGSIYYFAEMFFSYREEDQTRLNLESENATLRGQMQSAKIRIKRLESDFEDMAGQAQSACSVNLELDDQIEDLNGQLLSAKKEIAHLQSELADKVGQLQSEQDESIYIEVLMETKGLLKNQPDSLRRQAKRLEERIRKEFLTERERNKLRLEIRVYEAALSKLKQTTL
ncbi:MAG: hypothetical protein AAFY70_01965 [Bacteroidota bacterium]